MVVTRKHQFDELALELSVKSGAAYIGMAACSEKKKQALLSRLLAKGIPEARLQTVHAPIGLYIKAQTMEEMALSIMAEIVKLRRANVT